ncbi:MAG: hypothetical protein AMS21_12520 [Gemmatimonas sp. SG8_38_2]|nr:MAG: hypothetical protein AMS21_12520 [Gemmatimonas sp. SG8_38_2]
MFQRSAFLAAALIFVLLVSAVPAEAQRDFEPLFDKFNFKLEGSWVGLTTDIRLDSELLGRGTTLSFEDDLNLDSGKTIPTLSFEWQIAKKHKLGVRWQDINRDSTAQALTEIQWGDEIIPIDANISLGFDITQAFIDYAYYPWVKDRWAAGFGLGLRWMDIQATLAYRGVGEEETIEGSSDVKGSAPLPYIYFEYRRLLSDNWRFITGLGWLYVKIDDIEGGQLIGRLRIEYLTDRRWGFGAAVNFANAGVDWAAIATEEENILDARIDLDIWDFSVFVRVRF